jgi:hypothetical protein
MKKFKARLSSISFYLQITPTSTDRPRAGLLYRSQIIKCETAVKIISAWMWLLKNPS